MKRFKDLLQYLTVSTKGEAHTAHILVEDHVPCHLISYPGTTSPPSPSPQVRMVTGDSVETARAIATECGILSPAGETYAGSQVYYK